MKAKLAIISAMIMFSSVGAIISSPTTYAATKNCNTRILTFPAWYTGLTDANCEIKQPAQTEDGLAKFLWRVVLNLVEIGLQVVGYLCVGFIIYGGYKYMISAGSSDGMAKAKTTIQNAIIGLLISFFSIGIVNLITGSLT